MTTTYSYGGCAECGGGGDKLTSLTDAEGGTTTYHYDTLGRLVKETDPLSYSITYTYDSAGRLSTRTDAEGNTVDYDYDVLGRMTEKSFPDGTSANYEYDKSGRVTTASNEHESYSMTYDAGGRLLSTTDSTNRTITYAYDGDSGKKTSVTGPYGHKVAYAYNEAGRLGGITSNAGEFAFNYNEMGRRTSLDFPNGVTATYDYNDTGRLVNLAHTTSTGLEIVANAYTHDSVGNRTVNTDQARGAEYSYDTLYRLTEANYTTTGWSGVESAAKGKGGKAPASKADKVANPNAIEAQKEYYTYDMVGNRLTSEKANVYNYNDVNQLTSVNGTSYTYDKNGNLTQKSSLSETIVYTYNYENKLVKVVNSDGTTVTFKYDPFGRRIEKVVVGGETVRYFYDAEDIFFETDGAGTVGNRYTHGPGIDDPLALENAKGVYFYHADGLGSIVALTDATQTVVQDYQYGFFGDLKDQKNRIKQPYRYTGREWDKETGLYYYRARYYDAEVGRFTQKDPIGFEGGINLYNYVGANPINWTDPFGLLFGINAGEEYGEEAGLHWANKYNETKSIFGKAAYGFMGLSASLWTPCTSEDTLLTLAPGGAIGKWAGRAFWRYVGPKALAGGNWLTRGWGWSAPYGANFVKAADMLQLPQRPNNVIKVMVPWWKLVRGPRIVKGATDFGRGGGWEYYRGLRWP